jgi:membrane associated rhomboid family serine protease
VFLFPIERENPTRHRAYVVWALIAINAVIWVATIALDERAIYDSYGYIPDSPTLTTLFTSMYLHGGPVHLAGNMFFLWMFGDNVEDIVGSFNFVVLYVVCGIAATLAHAGMTTTPDIPLIGASGAISGMVGVYLVFFPWLPCDLVIHLGRWEVKTIKIATVGAVGFWFGEQLLFGLITKFTALGDFVPIAFWGHIGGAAAGFLLALILEQFGYLERYDANGRRNPFVGYLRAGD